MANGNRPKTFDLPYTEWGLKHWLDYDPVKNGDYTGVCLPFGFSRSINAPRGLQIMHNNDALAFLFEQNTWHIWVPLNGMICKDRKRTRLNSSHPSISYAVFCLDRKSVV